MEEWMRVKMEEISRENIKPTSPTPSHLVTLTLSLYDQTTVPFPTPILLFYPSNKTLDIAHLKASLSQTLDSFYPLAGRYETWNTINCNDEGVPFIVTRVSCPISAILDLNKDSKDNVSGERRCSASFATKLKLLSKFHPPTDLVLIGNGVIIAIQINVFTCGGFVLGLFHSNKPLDGTSIATFLRHWAARAAQSQPKLPDFEAVLKSCPPYPPEEDPELRPKLAFLDRRSEMTNYELLKKNVEDADTPGGGGEIAVKSFVFKGSAVSELKAKAASEKVTNPSRFLAVSAFIWKQLLQITSSTTLDQRKSMLCMLVDVRSKTKPPLPEGAMGNLCEKVSVDLGDHPGEPVGLAELVSEIQASINAVGDTIEQYNGEKRGEAKIGYFLNFVRTVLKYGSKYCTLVDWCKSFGCSDVDFGFGKPKWVVPTHERLYSSWKNTILLVDYSGSDFDLDSDLDSEDGGFEAWLFLEEKKMKTLESDQDFLAFASPNF